ncbi:MAG TPA: response regulator [Xanthomonadales bacterium]|jgi:twitching motility two-component system response regulator PilH|nr:response regulator [Xanthomonadales bacterium]
MAHILIVDDSPTDVKVLSGILERAGHHVSSAASAEAGIDLAKSARPDLILMDVIMPGMNGFQATRSLSRDPETSEIPVIIVTTKGMETDRVWGLRQGAKDFIVKPVNEKDLIDRIQNLLPQ